MMGGGGPLPPASPQLPARRAAPAPLAGEEVPAAAQSAPLRRAQSPVLVLVHMSRVGTRALWLGGRRWALFMDLHARLRWRDGNGLITTALRAEDSGSVDARTEVGSPPPAEDAHARRSVRSWRRCALWALLRNHPGSARSAEMRRLRGSSLLRSHAICKALGCRQVPGYTQATDECLLCRAPGPKDCVEHVFGRAALRCSRRVTGCGWHFSRP